MIKVVDIFAGPGGLSEGFSSIRGSSGVPIFDVVLSIEQEVTAQETLRLRKFFHQFHPGAPDEYYQHLRGEIDRDSLYVKYPLQAQAASECCWHAKLGPEGEATETVRRRIEKVLGDDTAWVLIGGPPCQAYSIAGRSRNKGKEKYDPETDVRQRLYLEYLQILAEHRPAVFVMENVKGLLSAKLANGGIFHRILEDLRNPAAALKKEGRCSRFARDGGYVVRSLTEDRVFENGCVQGAVIRAENYGIPQARHRVILLGIRDDIAGVKPLLLQKQKPVPTKRVIGELPRLRGGLTPARMDSASAWQDSLKQQATSRWANAGTLAIAGSELSSYICNKLKTVHKPRMDRGQNFLDVEVVTDYRADWFNDDRVGGICNHTSRGHMLKDLFRYFFSACYAQVKGISPSLRHFPTDLLPKHRNVKEALDDGGHFSDRFRVQIDSGPSTTIVSHISKDGHYYIHSDPTQCRSLTVREAARLQTFPDNYLFCGNRTEQYVQVGNAVPPLLARQIGEIVWDILKQAGAND